jgi:hypothetical protein
VREQALIAAVSTRLGREGGPGAARCRLCVSHGEGRGGVPRLAVDGGRSAIGSSAAAVVRNRTFALDFCEDLLQPCNNGGHRCRPAQKPTRLEQS